MQTLYELTGDYMDLLELAGSDDPDDEQAFADTLEAILGAIDVKADGYATVMAEINGRVDIIKAEIDRLAAMKRTLENRTARMKDALLQTMKVTGRDVIKTDLHTIKITKNGGKLPLIFEEGASVPEKWCKLEPDTAMIRTALETGNTEVLEFAHLGERGEHLSIR